jgi:orotidine-5'-phosphate decarboxylase|tara:strand:- start:249 stop:965 length:717 start_codon:yes stop_codon:yes gene_type:complete
LKFKDKNAIFCALDTKDTDLAISFIKSIKDYIDGVKIGMEAFYSMGLEGYLRIQDLNLPIFLDLKLHDIPNTVNSAIKSLLPLNPYMLNVHVSGGGEMLRSAKQAIEDSYGEKPLLVGVTILTSMNEDSFKEQGLQLNIETQVVNLSKLAVKNGLNGVVCSPHEAKKVKDECGKDFLTIVPGIRPESFQSQDQKRIMTPKEAVNNGADILIIGRPLTKAKDPITAAKEIRKSIENNDH